MKISKFQILIAGISLVVFISFTKAQESSVDVRNARWGMTMEEVIKSEGSQPTKTGQELTGGRAYLNYETVIEQRAVLITYYFENNRLSEINYRYYWGKWQSDLKAHKITDRMHSIYTLFDSFKSKGYIVYGKWKLWGYEHSPSQKTFEDCQSYSGSFIFNNENVKIVSNCIDQIVSNKNLVSIYIMYENARTYADVQFPTTNNSVGDEILGWVKFRPKGIKSDF